MRGQERCRHNASSASAPKVISKLRVPWNFDVTVEDVLAETINCHHPQPRKVVLKDLWRIHHLDVFLALQRPGR